MNPQIINAAFEQKATLSPASCNPAILNAINETIQSLDSGKLRVSEKINQTWVTHEWIKKAVLLYFKLNDSVLIEGNHTNYFDKVPLKFSNHTEQTLQTNGIRIVPPASARKGAYVAPNTVLMPSFINIGAYIDSGTLIDTWATVGSCAQIGKNVHISGGVGIGGVLEPVQAMPTIIEDNCFIGARSEIVEGVIVEENAVISMGVFIGQSTPIYDREKDEVIFGRIPAGSVVIPGTLPSHEKYHKYCAIIIKKIDEKTRAKTSLNELLRD